MKKLMFACAFLGLLCQSSFAMSPLFATPTRSVPDGGFTLGLLAIGIASLAAFGRKRK